MTVTETATELVPLEAGLFEMPDSIDGVPRLYGQRCKNCDEVFTSTSREYCANCGEPSLERILLGTMGTVHTYTTVYQKLPGSLIEPPYVIAQVMLPEGVRVQTVLREVDPGDVKIGMPVEIFLAPLEVDEGRTVVNFFFRPQRTAPWKT